MKMLINTLLLTLIMALSVASFAQPDEKMKERREKIEALKVAYLTEALDLSSKEAQVFWPIYNDMVDESHEVRKKFKKLQKSQKSIDDMSDKEVEEFIDADLGHRQQLLDIRKKYIDRFKEILSIKKVAKLNKAEHDFNRKVLEEFKRREGGMRGGDGPPGPRY